MATPSDSTPVAPRLKLTLRPSAESIVRSGHPWIYSDSIRSQNREGEAGELAVIYDRKNQFLAMGFYDPTSPLRVRILHVGKPVTLDEAWWQARLDETLARRVGVAGAGTDGLRLVNGESDGWPGLVVDRYAGTLVMKLYTPAWLPRLEMLRDLLVAATVPERIVLRLSRNLEAKASDEGRSDGQILYGPALDGVVIFQESGLRFEADVRRGQKTGFFLDQRENRRRVETLARGAEVLNAFSFTGGFSLYAARGGAKSVTDLDISAHAIEAAGRNFALNQEDHGVAACEHLTIQADAFAWLENAHDPRYDVVVVDPPSLAKRESERQGAIQAYGRLNANAIRLLRRGGVLVAASCSGHVSADEFFGAIGTAAKKSGRSFAELGTSFHAPDHHASFPEAQYLKCLCLKFD
ncbi:MAG: class I SAM-dependent rRNA methyltransferase [Verrucomicrobiales bacterium]|jgi:23S rRNA (cytosine1962-C5)-methyltransferase|nr:class I SAM-dependent rRNA methyltransferase [Verrucomicrobiales bacterium]MDP4792213.1 class I SAM-dependent rRNA methyltransferase [Verrucomicrobiales bacterium]MDP4939411.1 class I SAM-dependent rRNA methyltransferase [Verrucomicrobiales bacterium]MDP5005814.1 class I SAM-dependent rRNA methyltransferase [Verrucomicrobiales bacterium]